MVMELIDFEKGDYSNDECPYWAKTTPLKSVIRDFDVRLEMIGDLDEDPPDNEMISRANSLAAFIENHSSAIIAILIGSYNLAAAEMPHELDAYDIPRNLSFESIKEYIVGSTVIVTRDNSTTPTTYSDNLLIVPLWDEEHGLSLVAEQDRIVSINDLRYRIESGMLHYD